MNHSKIITEAIENKQTMFYLFYSDTCIHCEFARPIIQEHATKKMIQLHKIEETNNNGKLFDLFKIEFYPTLIYIKGGRVLKYEGIEPIVEMIKNNK